MLLLGDSHGVAIANGARALGLPLVGGMLGAGRSLNLNFYSHAAGDFTFRHPEIERLYRSYLAEAGVDRIADLEMPVLCQFAMNLHYLAREEVWRGFTIEPEGEGQFISDAVLSAAIRAMVQDALQFYRDLRAMGLRVFTALPPRRPRDTIPIALFLRVEEILLDTMRELGVGVVDHRPWSLGDDLMLRSEFAHPNPTDTVHANARFGARLLQQCLEEAKRA